MPTYEASEEFLRDYKRLTKQERAAFRRAVDKFKEDLKGGSFRRSLRVKRMVAAPGIFEMTWEGSDGRATFHYGREVVPGEPHIIWRRIGGQDIFGKP
jgi:hypothetical protein